MEAKEFYEAYRDDEAILVKQVQYVEKTTGVCSKFGILKDNTAVLMGVMQKKSNEKHFGELVEIEYRVPKYVEDGENKYPVLYLCEHVYGESGLVSSMFLLRNIKSFYVPEGVTTIIGPIFKHSKNIALVTLPTSIQFIKEMFWNCPNFEEQLGGQIHYLGTKEQWKNFIKKNGVDCGFGIDCTPWQSAGFNVAFSEEK